MLGRRLLVIVAVLMGLTALAASLAPPPQPGSRGSSTPAPSPTAAPPAAGPATPSPPPPGGTVSARLSAASSAVPRQVTAAPGDLVDLVVTGDVIDTVSIGGLSVLEPIDPESPARVELFADTPGRFPIRLLDARRRIGTLLVSR